jgi:glycosyltransferase involved in cell wall biosynthesis
MKLIGLTTVRDEEDIIKECITYALRTHDQIVIADCGSEDDTHSIVQRLAEKNPQILYLGRLGTFYAEQIRWKIWRSFYARFSNVDWWSILDADEFFYDDPKAAIGKASKERADNIRARHVDFYYKVSEYENWQSGREGPTHRSKSIMDRRRYYTDGGHRQIRFFKNASYLRWNRDTSFPDYLVKEASFGVRTLHYKYRDGDQLKSRIHSRNHWDANSSVIVENPHWKKDFIEDCLSPDDDPDLRHWAVGEALPIEPFPSSPTKARQFKVLIKALRSRVAAAITKQRDVERAFKSRLPV